MAFSELIKSFSKTRDYMRDFYIYSFKVRNDYGVKSSRTYDNEKRRIESWLGSDVRWENDKRGKRVYISLDTTTIGMNPLYNAWKAKSFTDNDITLHFAILSALQGGTLNIAQLTDAVCTVTQHIFELQTVRIKANEYVKQGLLQKEKQGKTAYYSLSSLVFSSLPAAQEQLMDAVAFFQGCAPFGFVGSTILDHCNTQNEVFGFKHHYIVHTLEDGILFDLLCAIHDKRKISFVQQKTRLSKELYQAGVPLQIFVSVQSGRRYLCLYSERTRRFRNYRLDNIKKVKIEDAYPQHDTLNEKLNKAKPRCWGVSFDSRNARNQVMRMTLHIDEQKEQYVLTRLKREGRNGTIERTAPNTFLYTAELFDVTEMMAWVKTFTGRILSLEGTNQHAADSFYSDVARMQVMYGGDD